MNDTCTTIHTDINECENGDDNCSENANCTNTEGSFTCYCNSGYAGDGVICTSKLALIILVTVISCFCIPLCATQPMEDVNTTVLIPLAASTVAVTLAIPAGL